MDKSVDFRDKIALNLGRAGVKLKKLWQSLAVEKSKNMQLTLLVFGVALILGLVLLLLFWHQERDYRPLYSYDDNYDLTTAIKILEASGIDYRLHPDSRQLLIATDDLAEARMAMANGGMPAPALAGSRWLEEKPGLGSSHYLEQKRFLKGLEEELSKTIISLQPIRSAKVHLAVPEQTAFLRDMPSPKAAVYLELIPGYDLKPLQAEAIMRLISGSLPGLNLSDVHVVDQHGHLLSQTVAEYISADNGLHRGWLEQKHFLESSLEKQVGKVLEVIAGSGHYKVNVVVELDTQKWESSSETYTPGAIRSESLEIKKSEADDTDDPGNEKKVRNYEVNRQLNNEVHLPGQLRRLSIAVLLNAEAPGIKQNSSESFKESLTPLIQQAVGFDENRGDKITLSLLTFSQPEYWQPVPDKKSELFSREWLILLVVLLSVALGLFFWFGFKKRRKYSLKQQEPAADTTPQSRQEPIWEDDLEQRLKPAREQAIRSPDRVAAVLKQWLIKQ